MSHPFPGRRLPRVALALLAAVGSACADAPEPPAPPGPRAADGEVDVPGGPGASAPRLAVGADGAVVLSWTQPQGEGQALRYATWTGAGWSPARTADAGPDRLANPADTPGVTPLAGGRMLAHVLTRGPSAHATDARVRFGGAGGWGEPALLNTDGVAAEHGFVSAVALPTGAGVVWLDGRGQRDHHGGDMALRYAELAADGRRQRETVLDARACDCCPTAAVATPRGTVVAYRDRSATEVRDVAVVRHVDGVWTSPVVPHADGWQIDGCPVNGPALAARGEHVALAWFTAADSARVRLAVSRDGGATWGPARRVDDGAPVGRVGVAVLDDGRAVVSWIESVGDAAQVRVRAVGDGERAASQTVATVPAGRASGIPRVAALGGRALVAWTDPEAAGVRTAVVQLPQ